MGYVYVCESGYLLEFLWLVRCIEGRLDLWVGCVALLIGGWLVVAVVYGCGVLIFLSRL